MHLTNVGPLWLRRYALAVGCCTMLLLIAGGLVTSKAAALSLPAWSTSWGLMLPPIQGGFRYESAHLVLALIVGLLTLGLAFVLRTGLAWAAVGIIAAEAALGGAGVILAEPLWIAILHACLGQVEFGLIVAAIAQAFGGSPSVVRPALLAVLLLQTTLGAAVRYGAIGLAAHLAAALIATSFVTWATLSALTKNMHNLVRRRIAMLLLSLTASQIFLGIAAYMSRVVYINAPQPMPLMVFFTVAHVATGALVFGAAVLFTSLAPAPHMPAEGGMVTA